MNNDEFNCKGFQEEVIPWVIVIDVKKTDMQIKPHYFLEVKIKVDA